MSKKSATVLVVFVIAIVAFCLANACALMTGTYHLDLFNEDNSTNILNNTTDNQDSNPIDIPDSTYQDVKSEDNYVSDHSSNSNSNNNHEEPADSQDSSQEPSGENHNPGSEENNKHGNNEK